MSEANVIFTYKDIKVIIPCKTSEKIKNILERFTEKLNIDNNKIFLTYNGNKVNEELSFDELANKEDKLSKCINIILHEINNNIIIGENLKKPKEISCPNCLENIYIKIEDIKISACNCENLDSIENKSEIDSSNIINDIFKQINNGDRKHSNENQFEEFKKYIDKFCNDINDIIDKLKYVLINIQIYYNKIFNNNYETPQNESININKIIKEMKGLVSDDRLVYKFKKVINIYELLNIKENNNDQIEYDNFIIGEINVLEENINKSTRIIGSFEECKREKKWKDEEKYNGMENEKEIKENCIIEINNKVIPFSYFYKFNDTGKYKIKYSFIKNLKNLNYLFFNCRNLTNKFQEFQYSKYY